MAYLGRLTDILISLPAIKHGVKYFGLEFWSEPQVFIMVQVPHFVLYPQSLGEDVVV